jgi:hypothetical protein
MLSSGARAYLPRDEDDECCLACLPANSCIPCSSSCPDNQVLHSSLPFLTRAPPRANRALMCATVRSTDWQFLARNP